MQERSLLGARCKAMLAASCAAYHLHVPRFRVLAASCEAYHMHVLRFRVHPLCRLHPSWKTLQTRHEWPHKWQVTS